MAVGTFADGDNVAGVVDAEPDYGSAHSYYLDKFVAPFGTEDDYPQDQMKLVAAEVADRNRC